MMRGLVAATLGQVTVLSLMKVTGILRGPQYPVWYVASAGDLQLSSKPSGQQRHHHEKQWLRSRRHELHLIVG